MLTNPCVVSSNNMTHRYVNNFKKHGINKMKSHTKKNLRIKITSVFDSHFNFVMSDCRKLLLYPDLLPIVELARQNDKLKSEL